MFHPDQFRAVRPPGPAPSPRPGRPACLVAGCPCRDPRIISRRRARFHAALALARGETAGRVIAPEPGWELRPLPAAAG